MGDFNRRTVFGVAAALAATGVPATSVPALAQAPAPRQKGPRVWLDMDQQELDDAYDQSKYAPNIQQVLKRYEVNSAAVRARLGEPKRLAYGPTPAEALDLYPARGQNLPIQNLPIQNLPIQNLPIQNLPIQNLPIHVFVHGGAWRTGLAKNYAFQAETFVRAGAHFITLDFTNVVETKGEMMPMAEQVRRALAWVYKNAGSFGGDANRIWLSGHSSGGHLAGVLLTTDWQALGVPKDIIKGGVCCSGLFDLKPARLSARSSYVKFTDEIELALSPQRHLDQLNAPVVVAYGTYETPEFQRQSQDFAAAVKAAGKPVTLLVAEAYNHFEIAETFANPYGLLGHAALEQMNLAPV